MEEIVNLLSTYWPTFVTVISTLAGAGVFQKFAPDKWLKLFIKSGKVAQKYADLVDKVEKEANV